MKYGRLPRAFSPAIPHWSALKMGSPPIAVPPQVNYTKNLPANLGEMLNATIGDCADAAYGHALQVWSVLSGKPILTVSDTSVEALYSATTGYVPGKPSTDTGTVLQALLAYLVNTKQPVGGMPRLAAFVELDPTNEADLNRATYEGALIYIGFSVPAYFEAKGYDALGSLWDIDPSGDQSVIGGHCVISAGYRPGVREIISWGSAGYGMTTAFWHQNVDEAYALVSEEFIGATGLTPLGLSLDALEAQMQAIRMVP